MDWLVAGYVLAWTGHVWVGLCGLAEGWWPWLVWVGVGELPGYGVCLCGLAGGCWPWLVWVGLGWSVLAGRGVCLCGLADLSGLPCWLGLAMFGFGLCGLAEG